MMRGRGAFVRSTAALALAFAVVASQSPDEGENPVKFGPVPTFPAGDGPYEPHETFRFIELPHETIGIVLAALVVLIASGAKIGGGAVLDAVYILVLRLSPKEAIPLASITIFGGALGDLLLNIWKKPINSSSSLINWNMMQVMQPMLLMGAAFGASIISWFSSWLFTIALIVYLGYAGKKAFEKTRAVGRDENWRWCSSREAALLLGAPSFSFQDDDGGFQYKAKLSWRELGKNFGLFGTTVLLTSLQGGKYFPSPLGIPPTSFFFIFVSLLPFIFLSVVSHYQMKDVVATYQRQQNPRFILTSNEVQVNFSPAAVSTMSATSVFFASGMVSFDFFLWGKLDLGLAKIMMPIGLVMAILGRTCLAKIVRKAKSRTLLLFAITAAMVISIVPLSFNVIRAVFSI
ncbi:hypothetical protein PHYBOEH_005749 [Phytophthora boehmeriae]|uniref:Membrane transporter protein n=1 Tax=Phytophthora boehmeriae TaxID=109152 RepID=A0A8T1X8L9_9STRA|nr:hypothetical protein PHYBOEH_005749 [Phytophthora boehmeriae]